MEQIYTELLQRKPKTSTTIVESTEEYECFELSNFPLLSKMVLQKYSTAKYVSVEPLFDPEMHEKVYNMMFFANDEEIVGGCELTKTEVYWDDDEDKDEDKDEDNGAAGATPPRPRDSATVL